MNTNGSTESNGVARRRKKKTITPAVLAANRQNGAKSIGPKTREGKEMISSNAVTHGMTALKTSILVTGKEDAAAYDALHARLEEDYRPQSTVAQWAVRELANAL